MALTVELIDQQETLKSLTPEQKTAITVLSKTDETTVIGEKMGTVLGGIDSIVKELTGKDKPHGTKTVDFVKTEMSALKSAGDTTELTTQLEKLKGEKADLEKQIADGSQDAALKSQVVELKQKLVDKETSISQLQTNLEKEKETYEKDLYDLEWKAEFNAATSGLTYKSEDIISKSLRDSHLSNVEKTIKEKYKIDYVNEGGTKKLVYRDEHGTLVTSSEDPTKPATLQQILKPSITDLLDAGHQQPGGGTGGSGGGGGTGGIIISGATTKVQATAMIEKQLATQGIARNSKDYQAKLKQAYLDNKVSELPLR